MVRGSLPTLFKILIKPAVRGSLHTFFQIRTKPTVRGSLHPFFNSGQTGGPWISASFFFKFGPNRCFVDPCPPCLKFWSNPRSVDPYIPFFQIWTKPTVRGSLHHFFFKFGPNPRSVDPYISFTGLNRRSLDPCTPFLIRAKLAVRGSFTSPFWKSNWFSGKSQVWWNFQNAANF